MYIGGTQYLAESKAFEIYVSGCNFKCKGCHNPELWDFNVGRKYTLEYAEELVNKIKLHSEIIDEIHFLGGEPLHQNQYDFMRLILNIQHNFPDKNLILFTGFNLPSIKEFHPQYLSTFDKIKCGRYVKELATPTEDLASSNQKYFIKGKDY